MINLAKYPVGPSAQRPGYALVIDDHPLFCDALELTLKSIPGMSRVVTAESLAVALDRIGEEGAPSLIVLDLNLPDVTGLDGLIRLKAQANGCPIMVVSSLNDNALISQVFKAGANGFVPKHSPRTIIKGAVDAIGRGERFAPPGFIDSSADTVEDEAVQRLATLTNQQARILELICDGKLNKQIAYDLSIAETTVKAHVTAIMRKLGVQNRTQAVLVAQEARFDSILHKGET